MKTHYLCSTLWILLISTVITTSIQAAEQTGLIRGNSEISIYSTLNFISPDEGDTFTFGTIGGSYGYFITDLFELGIGGDYFRSESDGFESNTISWRPFFKYHFLASPTVAPYVTAFFSYGFTENKSSGSTTSETTTLGAGFGGGIKFFVTDAVSLGPELIYDYQETETEDNVTSDQTTVTALFAVNAYF